MIAEDFGPVVHNGHVRVLATESIAGPTVEGAAVSDGSAGTPVPSSAQHRISPSFSILRVGARPPPTCRLQTALAVPSRVFWPRVHTGPFAHMRVGKNGGRARTREAKVGALWVVAPDGELVGIR